MKERIIKPEETCPERAKRVEGLTNGPQRTYSKEDGDIFMPEKGREENMSPNPRSTSPEHSEGIYGNQRTTDINTLEGNKGLPVEIRKALRDIGQVGSREKAKTVIKNASLGDMERINSAIQLLKRDLTEKQKEAILEAHGQGKGGVGKDNNEAGVYNYTQSQLLRKARILDEAGFSKEERRVLMEAGLVGAPVDSAGISDPAIVTKMDAMNNALDLEVEHPVNVLYRTMTDIYGLTSVNPVEKQLAIDKIMQRFQEEQKIAKKAQKDADDAQKKTEAERSMTYRFSFSLMEDEMKMLMKDPEQWANGQFDQVYALVTEEGQVLESPLIQNTQNKIAYAIDLIKASNQENLRPFIVQTTTRLHNLQMRTAIGYKDMEQIKGAAGQLRFHGLLMGMTLEKGRVGAMWNRLQSTLEDVRKSANKRHHVMLEDAFRIQDNLIDEQMDLAKKGLGSFGNLSDIEAKKIKDQDSKDSRTWDDFAWAKKEEKEIKANAEVLGEKRIANIGRIKQVNVDIVRAVRTAYDEFVNTQRMGVIVARGKYLLKDDSRYRSDPIGPLEAYNLEQLLIGRFEMLSPEQQEILDRVKIDIANNFLKKKKAHGFPPEKLTPEEKIDLGERLFRDLYAVPDQFSSGWRIQGIVQALEQRFESGTFGGDKSRLLTDEEKKDLSKEDQESYRKLKSDFEKKIFTAKRRAEEFALFMRLRETGQEQFSGTGTPDKMEETRKKREKIWGKIKDYRPEEIIGLFREKKEAVIRDLYDEMTVIDSDLNLTEEEKISNRPTDEGGRGTDLTVYDKFKQRYGAIIGLLRQEGFDLRDKNGNLTPRQINFAKLDLDIDQRETVNKFFKDENGAQKLIDLTDKMQKFIDKNSLIGDLMTKNDFADIYTRSLIVDDALLDKLEDDKKRSGSDLGYVPISKLLGEQGAGADILERSWKDTENAAKAGNALLSFHKEEELEKKIKAAVEFATSAEAYNGLGGRGRAECIRFTIGSYLNLTKLDMWLDVAGVTHLPFRIATSKAGRILGSQIQSMSRDELRNELEKLRVHLSAATSKAKEKFKEDLSALETSTKYTTDEQKVQRRKELEGKFAKDVQDSQRFFKDLEGLLEVRGRDTAKRFGLRLILYILLLAIGEAYKASEASVKDFSK